MTSVLGLSCPPDSLVLTVETNLNLKSIRSANVDIPGNVISEAM
jgi:hypothetical protein